MRSAAVTICRLETSLKKTDNVLVNQISYKFHSVVQYKFSVRTGNVSDFNVFCLS